MEWISLEDRAPDLDEWVLIYDGSIWFASLSKDAQSLIYWDEPCSGGAYGKTPIPTHWMPLPEPPVNP